MAGATTAILLTGVIVYGAYRGVTTVWHQQQLERTIPAALAGVRAQREVLVGIIEEYKARFGYYPPMSTPPGPSRGIVNPLCYELLGVRYDPKHAEFHIPITKDGLSTNEVQKYFNTGWFSNCMVSPTLPTNFLANRPVPVQPMIQEAELFGIGLTYTDFTPEPFWADYDFSAWRYATNPAQHNPNKFDLWVDVNVAGKHFTIGNWPEVK